MQIVIEIPQEQYNKLCTVPLCDFSKFEGLLEAIKNGIVLPEHYGDLIDRDALRKSDLAPEPWYRPMWGYSESEIEYADPIIEAKKKVSE